MLRTGHNDGPGNLAWTIGWVTFGSILLSVAVAEVVALLSGQLRDWHHYLFAIGVPLITTPIWAFPLVQAFHRASRASAVSERLAFTDPLTGLPNRRAFFEHAERIMTGPKAGGRSVAVLMIDVDQFKDINDTVGHHAGDAALCQVADALRQATLRLMRGREAIVARLGGDEFTILVPDVTYSALAAFAAEACHEVRRTVRAPADARPLTVSIGAALKPAKEGIDAIVRAADEAAYEAKRSGRDRWQLAIPREARDVVTLAPEIPHDGPGDDSEARPYTRSTGSTLAGPELLRFDRIASL